MTVAASSPGRCGIVGNPSDIYGGFLVSCSIPLRNKCVLELAESFELPEDRELWEAAIARHPVPPCRVTWGSQVPRSSGLAGSTALLAATLACVLRVRGDSIDLSSPRGRSVFAELVRDVELNDAGVVCGYQDAYMAVHGGLQALDFTGKHPIEVGPMGTLTALEAPLPFLLITTGVERLSGSVHGPIRDRWLAGDTDVIHSMEQISQLGRAGLAAIRSRDWSALAQAMDENQRLVAQLGGSGEAIDGLIAACTTHGAMSAKLAGAGMGGTVIALSEDVADLQSKLEAHGYSRFLRPSVEDGLRFESSALESL